MQPDLSLLPVPEGTPLDADGVPLRLDIEALPLELRHCFLAGQRHARDNHAACIASGAYGKSADEVETTIRLLLKEACAALVGERFTKQHRQAYRTGFRMGCAEAKRLIAEARAAQDGMARALTLVAAGLNVAAETMGTVENALSRPALPGLGAPLRRPLRPEDFGALPTLGRP